MAAPTAFPNVYGAAISVADSTALAAHDPSWCTLGTKVFNKQVGAYFTLTQSDDGLVTDEIVAVLGIDGARWVLDADGGGNVFFNATPNVYASPIGSDAHGDGTIGRPYQTLYKATQTGIDLGGANIYFTDQTEVGGPVDGQGLWLRNDNVQVPGWLNYQFAPLTYTGIGNQSGNFPFERPGAAAFLGGGGTDPDHADFFSPALWLIGEPNEVSFAMYNAKSWIPPAYGVAKPVNVGWDYVRRSDGTLEQLAITQGVRTGASTTYTVDLSTATPYTMLTASRFVGSDSLLYVGVTIQLPSNIAVSPWYPGSPIRVTTSDPDFPSILDGVVVHSQSDVADSIAPGGIVSLTYRQDGSVLPDQPVIGGTIRTHGLQAKDRLSCSIANGDFTSLCTVRVTGSTVDTVTINDVLDYGGDTSFTGAIGTLVKQERARHQMSGASFYTCSFWGRSNPNDDGRFGPTIDQGGTNAHPTRSFDCFFTGFSFPTTTDLTHVDQDRVKCAILADAGSSTGSGSTFEAYRSQSINGGVRWYNQLVAGNLIVDDWLQDSGGVSSPSFPVVDIVEGNVFGWQYINRAFNADTTTFGNIHLCGGLDPLRTHIGMHRRHVQSLTGSPPVVAESGYTGGTNLRSALWNDASISPATSKSPWETGQNIIWTGGLSTQHRGINRAHGVTNARFKNIFDPLADWETSAPLPTGVTVQLGSGSPTPTPDQLAPDGSDTAITINNTSGASQNIVIGLYPHTYTGAVGDRVFLGAWINVVSGVWTSPSLYLGHYDDSIFFDGVNQLELGPVVARDGWQWCAVSARVTALVNGGGTQGWYAINFSVSPGVTYLWAPTLIQIPAVIVNQDSAEYLGTLKHSPLYLPPGMSGTMEGTKLIAHGGLGIASTVPKVAGAGSGQLTVGAIVTYEPRYAADGTTVIGWAPLYAATVNP